MQTYLILFASILIAVVGQFLIKKGMMVFGPQEFNLKTILFLVKSIFTNFYVFFSLVCYAVSFLLWMIVLSKMKLAVVYPATSLVYVFVILGSYFIFKEPASLYQIIGIVLILIGLFFLFK